MSAGVEELERKEKEQVDKVIAMELEGEECIPCGGFSRLYVPSKAEYDRHCLTHLPYRSWCPICVQAK